MPESIDWPRMHPPRRRRRFLLILAVLGVILFGGRTALSYYMDVLWFESLGYGEVFWKTLGLQWGIFTAFAAATFLILYGSFLALKQTHLPDLPSGQTIIIGGQPLKLPVEPVLRLIALGVSLAVAAATGAGIMVEWPTLALFWYAPRTTGGVVDPIFVKALNFFLFTLPAWQLIIGWLLTLAAITCALAVFFILITGGTRSFAGSKRYVPLPWRGLSITFAVLLLVLAMRVYLGRFERLFDDHTIFGGVTYTDAHVTLTGMLVVCAALGLGALIAAANAVWAQRGRRLVAAILPAAVCYLALQVVAWYVSSFIVKPNELVREQPYIAHNIELTRQAYGLDRVSQREFPAETDVAAADPANNQATLQNIRLWDWHALQYTLRQIQEIRTYYDFQDIDVDRYVINGKPQAMMLAVRELSLNKLQTGSQNWVNERLIYTHGYGITMNHVSRFSKEGLPDFVLSNMPVESTEKELQIRRPEIYFGEITDWPVYVKTRQKEFNYPEGDANNYSTYEGTGGIQMGSFFRRLLLAWSVGDLTKVPFSDDITADSMLLMRRNIRERVSEVAPFLIFDDDPYVVIGNDGTLYWIIDGFTTSDRYPFSSHINVGNHAVNYIRNSVKTVVDAYNGTVHFYVFDTGDPLIQSYQKMFPALFSSAGQMPDFLRAHVRYPELLFRSQAAIYTRYHVENEQVFYNREDVWTIAQQGTRQQQGQQVADAIEPFFVLMRFPGSSDLEFVSFFPFTPANRNNLIGWFAGRSDGEKYGTLRAYRFPKTRFVDGPLQIQARIDQDTQLSSQLTLWNQQGSTVIRGNLLVIPLEDTLLFAEPIYLQAERSPMPELRLVVLATQDRLAYAARFPDAMAQLLEGRGGAAPAPGPPTAAESLSEPRSTDSRSLIDRANRALNEYRRLTSEGKLGDA